jgi:CubicO group peptidase (beta-lactamase class C family)
VPSLPLSDFFTLVIRFAITPMSPANRCSEGSPLTRAFPHTVAGLNARYDDQNDRFAGAFRILEEAIVARSFPAASIAVTCQGQLVALRALGHFTYDIESFQPSPETLFDLASLTKVVATTSMAMLLYQRGLLDLDLPVISVTGEFAGTDPRRDEVTFRMLLAHSSGLPAYERLFLHAHTREELLDAAFAVPLANEPGSHAQYSDIGFIVLGVALERLADETLDRFCQREIFGPFGMQRTTFNPIPEMRSAIPPTADDQTLRHRIIQGEVQDENASVLGGVAAHAGLFATAQDVAIFAHALIQGGGSVFRPETISLFAQRVSSPEGSSRALGWDTPSSPSQSGKYFSPHSFGHLGYTGTSLWIDPDRRLSITLLTNRTWPDCQSKEIQKIRPRFHDAVAEALSLSGSSHSA